MPEIETNLSSFRRKRGLSAIRLAATAGVSRQTIYAMEAGTFVPNTTVALRLARALETTVEELFRLPEGEPSPNCDRRTRIFCPAPAASMPARQCSSAAWIRG
jgi:DNA-binding XRE family transcriptional regulator